MCGITGIQVFSEGFRNQLELVHASCETLKQRGPDDVGFYRHNRCALGHRRLSIIDTTEAAAQPFQDTTKRYTLILNGEIFNYQEHRQNLRAQGITFRSESDTEVLLQLWINYKEACIPMLNGFFAFALYDSLEESLYLVRDRYGIKPLVYALDTDRIVFASELKALLPYGISREIDAVSVRTYFHLNYIPAPSTIFSRVKKLEPGHYMRIQGGEASSVPYYQLPSTELTPAPDYQQASHRVRELLEDAVRKRMIADVPLGVFLSGGIDSSVITGIASGLKKGLKSFSIGFPEDPFFDESRFAEETAARFHTDHTSFQLKKEELYEHLQEALNYLDEPFADSSALLVYILCQKARKEVTVALTGDGADELFSGYHKHEAEYRMRNKGWMEIVARTGSPLWAALPKSRQTVFGNRIRQLHKFSKGLALSPAERYWKWAGFTSGEELDRLILLQADEAESLRRKNKLLLPLGEKFNSVLYTDFGLVLQNDMLVKTDLMSMAHSMELRNPFLDVRLVDYVFSLPESYKINRNSRKRILKDACSDLLSDATRNRPKKGFEVPLLHWFRTSMKSLIFDDLLNDRFIQEQGIFNPVEVGMLKQKLLSPNPEDSVARIWAL
ncbi:MAG TPA: asparagine synthase (glutamine-hydrolyzing), partial [Bacteroidia bacterium]|nr:asparagine synthase (glutamine-hydrolyzing) [Bacteroidia bacterium]